MTFKRINELLTKILIWTCPGCSVEVTFVKKKEKKSGGRRKERTVDLVIEARNPENN